jgi:serine/threonine protein kinase
VLSERGTLSPQEAARIGAQVASALVAAHAAGIVHRDIKPANVLLSDDGTVKITDFGISRATGDVTVTATGMLAGTPAYLAPEVAKGEDPTPAADVFSLGSTLYTSVEGHSPFGLSENTLALLYAVAAGNITPPRQAGPLTALLMQLLRVEPAERPSLAIARDGLTAVADGRPTPAMMDAASAPTNRIAGNRRPQLPIGPPTPPRPSQPPWQQVKDGTRLDVHPFSEPLPSGPGTAMHREPMPSGPTPRQTGGRPRNRPGSRPGGRSGGRARSVVLTVLAIVAAMLVGILVATLVSAKGDDNGQGQKQTSQQQAPPASATEPTSEEPSPEEYEQAVRDYYDLLPDNTDDAFDLLTGAAKRKSGGKKTYERFWNTIDSVQVTDTSSEGNRVAAELVYETKGGATSRETSSFAIVERDGQFLIDNFVRLGGGNDG